jgi:dynein heavy chain
VVHITAVQAKDVRRAGVYSAPIYRGKARTWLRYIDQLQLRTDQPAAKWVLRGAAVLCSTD